MKLIIYAPFIKKNEIRIMVCLLAIYLIGYQACGQSCDRILNDAKKLAFKEKDYEMALKKLAAIPISKDCIYQQKEANDLIRRIYLIVNSQRLDAERKANRATALYWSSESDKIAPIQGLNLLAKAKETILLNKKLSIGKQDILDDNKVFNIIKTQYSNIFNSSNLHEFREIKRIKKIWPSWNPSSDVISPDWNWLLVKGREPDVHDFQDDYKLWNLKIGKISPLFQSKSLIYDAKFSPDGRYIVTSERNRVRGPNGYSTHDHLYDLNTVLPITLLNGQHGIEYNFSSNSRWLICKEYYNDGIRLMDLKKGKRATFLSNQNEYNEAAFSADSRWLLCQNSSAKTYQLWDLSTQRPAGFIPHNQPVGEAYFSKDKNCLIVQQKDGFYQIWNLAETPTLLTAKQGKAFYICIFCKQ